MTFPNFKNKHANDSVFSPNDYLEYQKKREGYGKFKAPKGVIFCYTKKLMEYVLENHHVTKVSRFAGEMYLINETNNEIAIIGKFGIGAPIVVTVLEELIAFGVERFISIGTAGTLQKSIKVGDLVICEKAIRDEGTSHHYLKPSKYAYASRKMIGKIKESLDKLGIKYVVGTSWTIDAPYRETVTEAKRYQAEGIATVEMEAAALFAVAKYRGVEIGAIFTASDSLAELKWKPAFHFKKTKIGLETLYKVAIDILLDKNSR